MGFGLGRVDLADLVALVVLAVPGGQGGLGAGVFRSRRIGRPGGGCRLGLLVLGAPGGLGGQVGVPGAFFVGLQSPRRGFRTVGLGGLGVRPNQSRGIVVRLCRHRLPGGIRLLLLGACCRGPGCGRLHSFDGVSDVCRLCPCLCSLLERWDLDLRLETGGVGHVALCFWPGIWRLLLNLVVHRRFADYVLSLPVVAMPRGRLVPQRLLRWAGPG